jgi:class 3 adenylate cyclase
MAGELLSQELETVAWSESILALEAETIAQGDFSRLAKDYRRLLKDLQRILRMSDRNELRLQKVSDELKLEKKRFEDIATRLSSYLPRQVYDSIFQGTQSFEIKSQRKLLTIFFSDIQGFTKISEALQPERLTSLINEYFSEMSAIAIQYGGTIDKFIGDAVMIFFGDPESKGHQKDALLAVQMAVAMQKRLSELNIKWEKEGLTYPLITRMGINTGWCTVGNFGSDQRMSYTIIGGEVNLTSRIESACEPGGVMLAYETYAFVKKHVIAVESEPLPFKGITRPVRTFQVKDLIPDDQLTDMDAMLEVPGHAPMNISLSKLSLPEKHKLLASLRDIANQLDHSNHDREIS